MSTITINSSENLKGIEFIPNPWEIEQPKSVSPWSVKIGYKPLIKDLPPLVYNTKD